MGDTHTDRRRLSEGEGRGGPECVRGRRRPCMNGGAGPGIQSVVAEVDARRCTPNSLGPVTPSASEQDSQGRLKVHSELRARLVRLGDDELGSLTPPGQESRGAWGTSYAASVAGSEVFIKRIPLTDLERQSMFSTANHFRLPNYYHYGVGSAGFGAFRELAAHQRTTEWVLDGAGDGFPLLHHWRVLPCSELPPPNPRITSPGYVTYWNNSKAAARYVRARAAARWEIWLILERFDHPLWTWLPANQDQVGTMVSCLLDTAAFLRGQGMAHLDAHFANVVTDGRRPYLTDFGLALDASFDLGDAERSFLARHRYYDAGEIIQSLGMTVALMCKDLPPEDRRKLLKVCEVDDQADIDLVPALVAHAETLASDGPLPISHALAEAIIRYRPVINYMHGFLTKLRNNPRKNARYSDHHLRRLLEATTT